MLDRQSILKMLDEQVLIDLWPDAGQILRLSRTTTYAAAERGEIETTNVGRLKQVPTAWLRRKLGLGA